MVNIEQITSTLAKLPDQALQRYAMMHKDDPYIMSLAVSESKRRKEMRSAGQAQGMQPQPKVVDQAVAAMGQQPAQQMAPMPEEQGIGALPAAQQMNFADGGITGYADGGQVERYQSRGLVSPYDAPRSMMGDIPGFVAGTGNIIPQQGAPEEVPLFRRWYQEAAGSAQQSRIQEAQMRIARGRPAAGDVELVANAAQSAQGATGPSPQDMAQFDAASNLYMTERAAKQAVASPGALNAAPKPDAALRTISGSAPSATPPAAPRSAPATPAEGMEAMQKRLMADVNAERAGLSGQRTGIVDEMQALRDKRATDYEQELAQRGDVFKGREERLAKQGEKLEGLSDKYMGLALLQAGAAMMTTPGGIGAALGKGVAVGSERYAAGMEKINAAQERFADAKDKLDELRINREDLTSAERRKLKGEADSAKLEGKKFMYEGAVSDLGMKHKDMDSLFGALSKEQQLNKELASKEKIAGMQEAGAQARSKAQIEATLNTPERLAYQGYLSKTVTKDTPMGDPAKAYSDMMAAKQEPKSIQQLKHDWSTDSMLQTKYKDVNDYIAFMSGAPGTPGATPGATPLPANASASTLKVGTVYQTAKGPAKWTGSGFSPI